MISLNEVTLQRGVQVLLDKSNLVIHPGRRVGVIGANGCGKSSLFKLLLKEVPVDHGELQIPATWRIAHMAQEISTSDRTAVDYVLDGDQVLRQLQQEIAEAEKKEDNDRLAKLYGALENIHGYDANYRAEQLLHGLGFKQSQMQDSVGAFSGGWRIRLNLAQALMCPSDLMLLDEPTNHLDLDATMWLEQWLKSYQGTLLVISHDRDFLDNIADEIVHIEHQQCFSYKGNYSAYEVQRAERLAQQQASFEKQQRRVKDIEAFVERFRYKASKAKQAQSRLKELQRMESIAPAHVDSPFNFSFYNSQKTYSTLISLNKATLGYGDQTILTNVELGFQPGSRIGLLGPNGAGKSTLIKSLVGDLSLLAGERVCGEHLNIGYFAQHQLEALDMKASAVLHIQRLSAKATEQEIRNFLGGFNFHGDKAVEAIKDFSGGEKARLALALIVWQKPNLLLLDEPTNHLDLEMCQALTMALQYYDGALVVISHDRHLLRNTVDQFYLVAQGRLQEYDGDLKDYQNWLKNYVNPDDSLEFDSDSTSDVVEKVDKKVLRQQAAERRVQLAPLTKELKALEKQVDLHQGKLTKIDEQLADASLYQAENKAQLTELLQQQGELRSLLAKAEDAWMEVQERLELIESDL